MCTECRNSPAEIFLPEGDFCDWCFLKIEEQKGKEND